MEPRKRILVVTASAGAGHVIAGDALAEALRARPEAPEVVVLDILQYSSAIYRRTLRDVYLWLARNNPHLFGYIYYSTNKELDVNLKRRDRFLRLMELVNTRPFFRFLRRERFDHIVTTHYLPPQLIMKMKDKKKVSCPLTTVTTDYGLHWYWLCRGTDHYVTADLTTKRHLVSAGVDPSTVYDYGIPVRAAFAAKKDRVALRQALGVKGARERVVLVLAGGFGVGPVVEMLGEVDRARAKFRVFAVAGRNAALCASLEERALTMGHPTTVVGYTDKIDEYMRAADLVVTKPGGLTVAESLAVGTPLVVINPIPGQENLNSDMLLEEGAAVKAYGIKQLSFKLDAVFADPAKLAWLKQNAVRLGKPTATRRIADLVMRHL